MSEAIRIYDRYRRLVDPRRIEYILADNSYSAVYCQGQTLPLIVCETLSVVQGRLPGFLRIHRSTLVNPVHLVGFAPPHKRRSAVYLSGNRQLAISRRYAAEVLAQVQELSGSGWPLLGSEAEQIIV